MEIEEATSSTSQVRERLWKTFDKTQESGWPLAAGLHCRKRYINFNAKWAIQLKTHWLTELSPEQPFRLRLRLCPALELFCYFWDFLGWYQRIWARCLLFFHVLMLSPALSLFSPKVSNILTFNSSLQSPHLSPCFSSPVESAAKIIFQILW